MFNELFSQDAVMKIVYNNSKIVHLGSPPKKKIAITIFSSKFLKVLQMAIPTNMYSEMKITCKEKRSPF